MTKEYFTSSSEEEFGLETEPVKATEFTGVLILTISIYISLFAGLTLMTLALGFGG